MDLENDKVVHIKKDKIDYLQFRDLLGYPQINHAYIIKPHGMNFRLGTDFHNLEMVKENLRIVSEEIGFDYKTIIRPDFEHTANVQVVDFVDNSEETPELCGKRFKDVDGLVTDKKNITLMATNADCNLIILFDPIKNVVGNIHAGWRGTFNKIASNAIKLMNEKFGCNQEDIRAYLCPSIRKCHFEVDTDVAKMCEELFSYTGKINDIIEIGEIKNDKQKYFIDTVLINKILLKENGILEENIFDSGICSVCCSELVHSRRAEGEFFGVGTSIVALK